MQNRLIWIVLLLGLGLRFISLNQSLWLDEATSVLVARDLSIGEILTKFSPGDFHPPLYYMILKAWILPFGSSEVAVRSLSILFGAATIWVVYAVAKKLFSEKVGLVTALFLATSPLHIYYSQEARMYVLETLLASLVVLFFLKKSFAGLVILSALLVYTDYLPVFLLLSLAFYLLVFEWRSLGWKWIGWPLLTAVLFAPWVPTLFEQFLRGSRISENALGWWQVLGKTNPKELLLVPVKFMIGRISAYDRVIYGVGVAISSVVFILPFVKSLQFFKKTKILWFWLVVPFVLAAIFGLRMTGFSYFRLLFILPVFYLLLAFGTTSFKNTSFQKLVVISVVLVNLIAVGVYLFNPRFYREDWRGAVRFIETNSSGKSVALFVSNGQQEAYKYYASSVPPGNPGMTKEKWDNLWLVRYAQPIFDPKDKVRVDVEQLGYKKVGEYDFNGVVVWWYKKV